MSESKTTISLERYAMLATAAINFSACFDKFMQRQNLYPDALAETREELRKALFHERI